MMVDETLVSEVARRVGEQLVAEVRRLEADGTVVAELDRRQMARAVIQGEIETIRRDRMNRGMSMLLEAEEDQLADAVHDRLFGLARIQPLIDDPNNTDITIYGYDIVWLTKRDGSKVMAGPVAESDEELIAIIQTAARRGSLSEKSWDQASPELDLQLPSGDRLHALAWVTQRPAISIRRHNFDIHRLDQLKPWTMSASVHALLVAAAQARFSILVAGQTGAGKTTLLRCLLNEIDSRERIVTIEDSLELGLSRFGLHPDLIEAEARTANTEGVGEVTMAHLVRQSLRMNPDRVVVGEIRGVEVVPMLLAMSQGNDGSMSSIHADSSASVFQRLAMYMAMTPESFSTETSALMVANALDLIVHITRLPTGERVISSIREVTGADGAVVVSNETYAPDASGRAVPAAPFTPARMDRLERAGFDPTWHRPHNGAWETGT